MKPVYFLENAYSIYPHVKLNIVAKNYEIETPETRFEFQVFSLFQKGKKHLYHEEYNLALNTFKELSQLILKTVHPTLPPDPNENYYLEIPKLTELLDPMLKRSAEMLRDTPVPVYIFPDTMVSKNNALPAALRAKVDKLNGAGLKITSHHAEIKEIVDLAIESADKDNWENALQKYTEALDKVPDSDPELKGAITHDLALINEKLTKNDVAIRLATESAKFFDHSKNFEKEVDALKTLSGVLERNGKPDEAKVNLAKVDALINKHKLHIVNTGVSSPVPIDTRRTIALSSNVFSLGTNILTPGATSPLARNTTPALGKIVSPTLMTANYLGAQPASVKKAMTINGKDKNVSISLSGNLLPGMKQFYKDLTVTTDIGILTGYLTTPAQMVAYLPHMYFYVLPMAIADCEIGMGNLIQASERIENILKYPYLNINSEVVAIWTKLADCFIDLGHEAYKDAKDNVASYTTAKTWYEKIVKTDETIDANSPLYKDSKFSKIKKRVIDVLAGSSGFITANGGTRLNENPTVLWRLREAETMLFQIKEKLNFFGFDKDYIPPFSFEYLQDTSRYFASHASQMEQKYIQYKSTAETEELRADQLGQQVELAQQSVILEQRAVAEAQAGINVSEANQAYAETRRKNAVDQKNEFNDVRWELLEYAEAEAWANASSVDGDDQVKLSWTGNYYNSSKKKRNEVIQDLAYKKTRISHDLQAQKLVDEVAAANAYKAVANAQLAQSRARKAVAEKRAEIAQLQLIHAQDNKQFLDLKEFGAGMWYQLAKKTKRLVTRYLDQATEISFLMERAYNAETERDLNVIRYNYAPSYSGFLVGADTLIRDIDYFTFDYITNIKSKKAPVKKTFSLSDHAPNAFENLISKGSCQFETVLEDFDREFPGMYLCKIKNVELVFVGITKALSIAGTMRNIGVSKFKRSDGSVVSRLYPADVMPLSQYDIRQDALAFRFDPRDLKLFENNGLATIWELQLRRDANDFDFREILDIQMIIYYDGFHNSALETNVIANLPPSGNASRAFSMQLYFPDELYYLRTNGEGIMDFDNGTFPYNQTDLKRNESRMKVLGEGDSFKNLTLKVHSATMNKTVTVKTNNEGIVPVNKFTALKNGDMIDQWTITIPAADNPQLVVNNELDLSEIKDLIFLVDYKFKYRV